MNSNYKIKRKDFINRSLIVSGSVLIGISTENCSSGDVKMVSDIRFNSLKEAMVEIEKIDKAISITTTGNWDINQIFEHLAQSIEYSLTGYPENKPYIIRKTVGRVVMSKFLGQGYMSHNLNDGIPGAPKLNPNLDFSGGLKRLKNAVYSFTNYSGEPKIHFVYDSATKEEYDRIHAMHIANHLSALDIKFS